MNIDALSYTQQGFAVEGAAEAETLTLRLSGDASLNVGDRVDAILKEVHAEAKRRKTKLVVIDLGKLEFMNSSCFKVFVTWISSARELPAAEQYRIRFLSNPAMYWQRRSLLALQCFASELITIEKLNA